MSLIMSHAQQQEMDSQRGSPPFFADYSLVEIAIAANECVGKLKTMNKQRNGNFDF